MTAVTTKKPTTTPWLYYFLRLLFKFLLRVFYGSIVVENEHYIPPTGDACVICANHANSLTDAALLIAAIPSRKRNFLRMTAKDTQFGHKTFTSWVVESLGTVPLKRRKDHPDGEADNTVVLDGLVNALQIGDCVCLFPEGMSRYHPGMAPLKTGVGRIISDALTSQRDDPDYELTILTCSITYMHRQRFRSDVLVSFNPPLKLRPKDFPQLLKPVEFGVIRSLMAFMQTQISAGTIDVPSWETVRVSKLAARIYAPLGTQMALSDFVRVWRVFADAFSGNKGMRQWKESHEPAEWSLANQSDSGCSAGGADDEATDEEEFLRQREELAKDLSEYQDFLVHIGIKDDRIRREIPRTLMAYRIFIRTAWLSCLVLISLPGLTLWAPVFITTHYAVRRYKKTGPIWDTFDEIAQYKMVYGFAAGLAVWVFAMVVTWPIAPFTAVVVPAMMWITLRWVEDAVSAFRALVSLFRLFMLGSVELIRIRAWRQLLHARVMALAYEVGLPQDPERYFGERGGRQKGRVRSGKWGWESGARYFSLNRRRKRDWNEALRWYDVTEYPRMDD